MLYCDDLLCLSGNVLQIQGCFAMFNAFTLAPSTWATFLWLYLQNQKEIVLQTDRYTLFMHLILLSNILAFIYKANSPNILRFECIVWNRPPQSNPLVRYSALSASVTRQHLFFFYNKNKTEINIRVCACMVTPSHMIRTNMNPKHSQSKTLCKEKKKKKFPS